MMTEFDQEIYDEWQRTLKDREEFARLKALPKPKQTRDSQKWENYSPERKKRQYEYAKLRRKTDPEYKERRNKGDRLRYWSKRMPQLHRRITDLQEQLDELMEFAQKLQKQ